jgi:putative ABC transport system permease protein
LPSNLTVVSWLEDAKEYIAMSSQDKVSTYIMVALLFILAVIGISNSMLMAVFERTKEIGMLRALGMKDADVLKLFLIESGLIGLIGSLIGIALGILINFYMVYYGIDYTEIMKQANMKDIGYRVVGIYKSAWNWGTIIASGFIASFVAAAASFFPARKAVKMNIVDTLRFE